MLLITHPHPNLPPEGEGMVAPPLSRGRLGGGWVLTQQNENERRIVKGQTNHFVLKNKLQRSLRSNMTDAERLLWKRLRGCQIQGFKFRRQHPFGDFILDFVCLERKLAIEIDGGQHNESAQDQIRDQALENAGFRVVRFWNNQVLNELDAVVEAIWLELGRLNPHPSNPPPS